MVIIGAVAMTGSPSPSSPTSSRRDPGGDHVHRRDALTVEQSVATPIEQQMSGVDDMNYMYSTNANNGQMTLKVNFDVKTDTSIDPGALVHAARAAASQLRRKYAITA